MSEITREVKGRELPINVNSSASTLWWGFVLLIIIELTFFAGLIASYFYLRFMPEVTGPSDISKGRTFCCPVSTPSSCLSAVGRCMSPIHRYKKGIWVKAKIGLIIAMVLGILFLVLKVVEYAGYDYTWATNAYASITWTISGFHSAHVLGVVLKVVVVVVAMTKGYYSAERNLGVRVNGLYWHFVVVVWVPLFFTLYLSHYVLPLF
jgi:cytochrome c oxidase subunit III